MGCHTWINKNLDYLTDEEYKVLIVDEYLQITCNLPEYLKAPDKVKFITDLVIMATQYLFEHSNEPWVQFDPLYGKSDDYVYKYFESQLTRQESIYNYLCNHRINSVKFRKLGLDKEYICVVKNKTVYICLDKFIGIDQFRVYYYPRYKPTSYRSLMRWLFKNRVKYKFCHYEQGNMSTVIDKEFRLRMKRLFNAHGGHLLIEFG